MKLEDIEKEIDKLEQSKVVNYNICSKLATLYIVKDHLKKDDSIIPPVMAPGKVAI